MNVYRQFFLTALLSIFYANKVILSPNINQQNEDRKQDAVAALVKFTELLSEAEDEISGSGDLISDGSYHNINARFLVLPNERTKTEITRKEVKKDANETQSVNSTHSVRNATTAKHNHSVQRVTNRTALNIFKLYNGSALEIMKLSYQPTPKKAEKTNTSKDMKVGLVKYNHHKRNKGGKKPKINETRKFMKSYKSTPKEVEMTDQRLRDLKQQISENIKVANLSEKANITLSVINDTKILSSETSETTKNPSGENSETTQKSQNAFSKEITQSYNSLRFNNGASGKVKTGQEFAYISQCGLYTEPQNVSAVQHSWVTKTYSPYFYLYEKPKKYEKCKPSPWLNGTDLRGSVFLSFEVKSLHGSTMENNAKICEKYCCKEPRCAAWVLRLQADATSNCPANSYCCWLKTDVPHAEPHDDCVSGKVHRDHYRHPPTGMRSSIPLGGLGAGSFELRADGTFHEWTIENQSPGGSAKLSKTSLEMLLLGVRVKRGTSPSRAAVLRTHAPHGFDGVYSQTYAGSYPVSKLSIELNKSVKNDVKLDLYAHSAFHPRKPKNGATPAVAFTLKVNNPSASDSVDVAFMMNLPFGYHEDTIRRGNNFAEIAYTRLVTATDCQNSCAKKEKCMAWTTNGPFSCMLKDGMPLHSYEYGIISGLKGEWSIKEKMLNCKRPGFYPQSGDISMYPVNWGSELSSFTVSDDPEVTWNIFKETGSVTNTSSVNATGLNGAVSTRTTLKPKETKILTIVFAWYFPNRDISDERVGNFYNNLFKSSVDVAKHMAKDLKGNLANILKWQQVMMPPETLHAKGDDGKSKKKQKQKHSSGECNSTMNGVSVLPDCLQDVMMNSLSSLRTGMWMENGRWRQWETFDCANMDPAHVEFHRIIPYIMLYPEITKQVMLAWADHQLSNGMIQESLSMGCLEETSKEGVAGGRMMTDVNVGFIVQSFMVYKWTNDTTFFKEIYPFAIRAMSWLIGDSTKGTGLPYRKPDTYDLFELEKYDHCAYNSVLYLLALKAARAMAVTQGDTPTLRKVDEALKRGEKQFEVEMWDDKKEFYHAWFDDEWGSPAWLMSDILYGQVWAYTLGLGDLLDREKMKKHLKKEEQRNDTPYGLKIVSKAEFSVPTEDTSVILGDELNSCKSLENITKTESVWMSASTDWSTLQLYLDMQPHLALEQSIKSLDNYRYTLRDQWNFHGLTSSQHYGLDGLPWATSHYTFHLVLWHLPLALSGQQYSAITGALTFEPKFNVPYWLPFYTPTCMGNIEAKEQTTTGEDVEILYQLTVATGNCVLKKLSISDSSYGEGSITILEGETVKWSTPKKSKKEIVKDMLAQLKHR